MSQTDASLFAPPIPSGCPAPSAPTPAPVVAPKCQTCGGGETKKHVVSVQTVQLGPLLLTKIQDLVSGKEYSGAGLGLPLGLSMSQELATVFPLPGKDAADVITGSSVGASIAGEGLSPSASASGNASGVMLGAGLTEGVTSGVTGASTYTWETAPPHDLTYEESGIGGNVPTD